MRAFLTIQTLFFLNFLLINNVENIIDASANSTSVPINSSVSQLSTNGTAKIKKLFENTILVTLHLKNDKIPFADSFTPLNNVSFESETPHEQQQLQEASMQATDWSDVFSNFFKNLNKQTRTKKQVVKDFTTSVEQSELKTHGRVQLASQSSKNARLIDESSTVGIGISQQLNEQFNGDVSKQSVDLSNFQAPSALCPFKFNVQCNASDRFPSLDGSCNNLRATWLGKSETPYKRYLPAAYDDGINTPRSRSVLGGPLPNPRVVSRALFDENNSVDNLFTHFTAIFGQFLAHDVTSAAIATGSDGRIVDCPCNNGNPSCMSINMPSNENLMRMSCMRMTRSSSAFSTFDCRFGHREQLNLLTSFLDLTQVYGPNSARSQTLRLFQGGQLKSSILNGKVHMPQAVDGSCKNTDAVVKCFAAGEGRTNENAGLSSLQTLFLREHNRVAAELASFNPTWDDQRLFNEARKIMIGVYQNIVYNEYLPAIIGWNTAAMFDLVPLSTNSYYSGYSANINPSLSNEFATAAFRFGHTSVRNTFGRFSRNNQQSSRSLVLQDIIFNPVEIYNFAEDGIESIIRGLINEPESKFDTNFADSLQNHLFESRLSDGSVIAIDLASTNINRGRDHGIPSYNSFRQKCGLKKANTFQDLGDHVPLEKIQAFQNIYQHPDDIDLYVGGLAEKSINGAVVGPTFACIIANQFKELKKGDRFYYENGPSPTAFTLEQLREIKKSTMARMMCDNVDISLIQPNAFMLSSSGPNNQKISCNWLRSMDLSKWRATR